jgi:glycosyltransferase involved in cell wall biosynthesis
MRENSKFKNQNLKISVIIPAYNEEKGIEPTVKNVVKAIGNKFSDYEIIIFDDCSKDKTGEIADALARENSHIKVVHNGVNKGFAYNYKKGIELAKMDYIAMFPGDDETEAKSIEDVLNCVGRADIIIPYTANQNIRPLFRQIVSYSFTFIMNFLFFGKWKLNYFNGTVVHKKNLINSITIKADNFAFQAEALVKLIKKGCNFVQLPIYIKPRPKAYRRSSAMKIKNLISVVGTILNLYKEIYFSKK